MHLRIPSGAPGLSPEDAFGGRDAGDDRVDDVDHAASQHRCDGICLVMAASDGRDLVAEPTASDRDDPDLDEERAGRESVPSRPITGREGNPTIRGMMAGLVSRAGGTC